MKNYFFSNKLLLFINIIFIFISACFEVSIALVLKFIVDIGSGKDFSMLYRTIFYSLIFVVFLYITDFLKRFFQILYTKKIMISLRKNIFRKIVEKDINDFNKENSAQYISMLTNDMNIIETDYFNSVFNIIFNSVRLFLGSIVIINLNIYIALSVFVMGAVSLLIPIIFNKKISKFKKNYSDKLAIFTTKIKDIFSGFEVIKSFNIENKINKEFQEYNCMVESSKYTFLKKNSIVEILTNLSGFLVFFTALCIATYLVMDDKMTFGSLIASVQLMNNIINPIAIISVLFNKVKSVKLIEEKIEKVTTNLYEDRTFVEKEDFNNSIRFNNVSFKYIDEKNVLNNISFELKKGNKYAIVGTSGSGKSTIIKLLLNYYNDFDGEITIDNISSKDIKPSSLYKMISIIHQNVFMFDGSIKDNITLFENFDELKVEEAIKFSGLNSLVNSLDNGYNSSVGENGQNISGGEKQRIAIARSIIRKTPILVLDEATSSLDNETGYNIENSILSIPKLTCLVITHKLIKDLLIKYDGIIVIQNGTVVEFGNFDELIDMKGYFYSLYNISL
ncbi:ABC transporter ATP-binding protein (plasmid) [Clostridium perfringens]|uniref:ABC transporter n=3 Tax=Clostridium perfringens TaxID=1502 RepID=A0A2X2Y934_CLOPF|nr:ABC transporter ATP-binding protein [Clostridium perfringens]EDS79338.1 ABC-type multidrug/protein/lipid transport system, ATPase component [Clostridium perfringens C str. JGS1495]ELC8450871.1 ABC transporter ATP-binding protein [Clostridium perfringens]MBI6029778.1 ABC transporter ATP-binding protein [Clostridium perfringens]MBI6033091.1 ABC transporter ATP-binding protein [Clostridium perfringens]MBI6067505.1 ABC transporter ATP-binding protein [Clostridium perfringens]